MSKHHEEEAEHTDPSEIHPVIVQQAKYLLLSCGFTEETLATLDNDEILYNARHQYQQKTDVLKGSIQLLHTPRWLIFLTPFRWRWEDIEMYGWRLLHKGPFLIWHFPTVEDLP